MISYYELLGMIKEDKAPNKIKVHLTSKPRVYEAQYDESDFSHYFIYDGDADEDYHYYLTECFLESDMFDDKIEILDKKIPEKINLDTEELRGKETIRAIDYLFEGKINEILDYLQEKE